MTNRALFHRNGVLVIKNESTGAYEQLVAKIAYIAEQSGDKQSEILIFNNRDLKIGLKTQIHNPENDKKYLVTNAKAYRLVKQNFGFYLQTQTGINCWFNAALES